MMRPSAILQAPVNVSVGVTDEIDKPGDIAANYTYIYDEGELDENSTSWNFLQVRKE